jgi:predicted secreted protein
MAIRLGLEAKLYMKPNMADPGPWVEMGNVKDLTLNLEKGEADVTTRANAGWRAMVGTLKEGSVEWNAVWDTEDAGFTAIKNAYFGNTAIALAVMDGPIDASGSQGLQADMSVISFSRSEPLEESLEVQINVKPTYSTTPPAWVEVS